MDSRNERNEKRQRPEPRNRGELVRNSRFSEEFMEIVCNHRLSWTAVKAKILVKQGKRKWIPWMNENFGRDKVRRLQDYMFIAKHWDNDSFVLAREEGLTGIDEGLKIIRNERSAANAEKIKSTDEKEVPYWDETTGKGKMIKRSEIPKPALTPEQKKQRRELAECRNQLRNAFDQFLNHLTPEEIEEFRDLFGPMTHEWADEVQETLHKRACRNLGYDPYEDYYDHDTLSGLHNHYVLSEFEKLQVRVRCYLAANKNRFTDQRVSEIQNELNKGLENIKNGYYLYNIEDVENTRKKIFNPESN